MKIKFLVAGVVLLFGPFFLFAQETGSFTDTRDGRVYKTVKIGKQVWMAENLDYETAIPTVGGTNHNGSWKYSKKWGHLYNWETAKKACPEGWHLPSETEWMTLINFAGGENVAGGKLKEVDSALWEKPNIGATNEFGFSARPGGLRVFDQFFLDKVSGTWWSSTECNQTDAWSFSVKNDNTKCKKGKFNKISAASVRCIKD